MFSECETSSIRIMIQAMRDVAPKVHIQQTASISQPAGYTAPTTEKLKMVLVTYPDHLHFFYFFF